MFFQCLGATFSSTNRARVGTNWDLLSYCIAMFSFVTMYIAMDLNLHPFFTLTPENSLETTKHPRAAFGYQWPIHSSELFIVPDFVFMLDNWLVDGPLVSSFLHLGHTGV